MYFEQKCVFVKIYFRILAEEISNSENDEGNGDDNYNL